ncbi:response regulator [Chryseobacterium indoltheticum]|uniref:Mycobacterial persistence regulator A n=1 Tax=Chryseobacterium indoltheticum TaxID=254 RepID=A0A381FCB2_9FLAO|nr:response regulator [Chryseobacterium indoltheticum]SUX44209.1 Mycobacterial persistence regulator A [Chryseobacterium indoltheticum]
MNTKRILIFDDDKSILDVFTIIFSENGYEVEVSETSHNIIERVTDFRPHLILMDNWIPDIGGIEAVKLLRNHSEFKDIPVIYISANSDINTLAKKAEADDYLAKPFELQILEKKVEKFLGANY